MAGDSDDSGLLLAAVALLVGGGVWLFMSRTQASANGQGGTQPPALPSPGGDGSGYGGGYYVPPNQGGGGVYSYDPPPSTYTPPPPPPPPIAGAAHMSAAALNTIKQHEGLRLTKYPDAGGWSIGYGHHYPAGQTPPASITAAQAQTFLLSDVAAIDNAMAAAIHVPLSQNEWDAVGDLVYNIGTGAFRTSTMLQKINASDFTGAASEFARWVYTHDANNIAHVDPSLVTLRAAEKTLFQTPAATS